MHPGTRCVVVLFGPPGAGKSTVAGTRPAGWECFDYDAFVWLGESHRSEANRSAKARAFTRELTALGRRDTVSAVVIRVGADPAARSRTMHQCRATYAYRVDPGEPECLRRLSVRSGTVTAYARKGVNDWYRAGAGHDLPAWPGAWPLVEPVSVGGSRPW